MQQLLLGLNQVVLACDEFGYVLQSHILVSIEDAVFELSEENELIPSSLEYSAAFGGHMP